MIGTGLILLAALAGTGQAAGELPEVIAESGTTAQIQAAVTKLGPRGTVRVPAGDFAVVQPIVIGGGVNLIGAGPGQTRLVRAVRRPGERSAPVIRVEGRNGQPSRISGFELIGVSDPKDAEWDDGILLVDALDFRVDHCRIERFGTSGVHTAGVCRGVVDHCELIDNFKRAINNVGYGVVVMGPGTWREKFELGGPDAVFIEDCEFRGERHAVASNGGAHYVFRHNRVIGNQVSHGVDAHGPGYGSKRGTQWVEVYENLIERPASGQVAMVFRGGGGVVFNNTVRDYTVGIQLTLDFDTKLDWTRSYPIPDQVHDFWLWSNTIGGKPLVPAVPGRSARHIVVDRDYHLRPRPGYSPYRYPHPLAAP